MRLRHRRALVVAERALFLTALVSVIVMAVVAVAREVGGGSTGAGTIGRTGGQSGPQEREVDNWAELVSGTNRLGPADASVVIVEFADFECPVCRYYNRGVLRAIRERFPRDVAIIYRHWPLSYHDNAYAAAAASECAAAQGKFEAFHDTLFEQQDALGRKSFDTFAAESGVPDLEAFKGCVAHGGKVPAIEDDIAMALGLGAPGTPTFVINGVVRNNVDSAAFEALVEREVASSR